MRDVFVEGRRVVADGHVVRVDWASLLAEARAEGDSLRAARDASHGEGFRLMPALREAYERAWGIDVGSERYLASDRRLASERSGSIRG